MNQARMIVMIMKRLFSNRKLYQCFNMKEKILIVKIQLNKQIALKLYSKNKIKLIMKKHQKIVRIHYQFQLKTFSLMMKHQIHIKNKKNRLKKKKKIKQERL